MLASSASELKQQGALEAARNPDSKVSAEDAERVVMTEARRAGVAAVFLDPKATNDERAETAQAVRPMIKPEYECTAN